LSVLRWRKTELPDELVFVGRLVPVVVVRRAATRLVKLKANSVSGCIELSLPARGGEDAAAALLRAHHGWLEARIARWPQPQPFVAGGLVPIDGLSLAIDWRPDHPRTPRIISDTLQIGGPQDGLPGRIERWLKSRARSELAAATMLMAAQLGRPVARINIGDQASRWGSCAGWNRPGGATISYSWRLIMAPAWVRQSIVAHEAAHLVHPNHSPAFHALNRQLDPRAGEARRWLALYGASLHWAGRSG
jgi:predicted metal-dependent hydrolase